MSLLKNRCIDLLLMPIIIACACAASELGIVFVLLVVIYVNYTNVLSSVS